MSPTIKTHALRTIDYFKRTWDELNYAQRRMLEIKLGLPLDERSRRH